MFTSAARKLILLFGFVFFIFIVFTYILSTDPNSYDHLYVEASESVASNSLSDAEKLWKEAEESVTNFPYKLSERFSNKTGCIRYPNVLELDYYGTIWQVYRGTSEFAYLYGAYFDDRPPNPVVRLAAIMNVIRPKEKIYCQMWFENLPDVKVTSTMQFNILWNLKWREVKNGTHVGQLITCPLPEGVTEPPVSISLASAECMKPSNNLVVHNERTKNRKDFVVCVKGVNFPFDDYSVQLVEFVESYFLFGVDKIEFFTLGTHQNMSKVLEFYRKTRNIRVNPITIPSGIPNQPFLRHLYLKQHHQEKIIQELIPYQDCFYRNLYAYNYVILVDIDEIFVPNHGSTYTEMIRKMEKIHGNSSTFFARNKMFVVNTRDRNRFHPSVPKFMDILQVSSVAQNYESPNNKNVKSFFSTRDLLTLNNHMPYECIGKCRKVEIPDSVGQLNHYRQKCFFENWATCNAVLVNYTVQSDYSLWRFKDQLVNRTTEVLMKLKLIDLP